MNIAIAGDHAGYDLKQAIIPYLTNLGHSVTDLGTDSAETPSDYPDFAEKIAVAVLGGQAERGILVCGSGIGVAVAANKIKGIYAGTCHDTYSAHQSVEHDNANVLCIGARIVGVEVAREIAKAFVSAQFTNEERHVRRVAKTKAIEEAGHVIEGTF